MKKLLIVVVVVLLLFSSVLFNAKDVDAEWCEIPDDLPPGTPYECP